MLKTLALLAALAVVVTLTGLILAGFAGLPLACSPLLGAAFYGVLVAVNS